MRDSSPPEHLFLGTREVGCGKVSCEGGAGETRGLEQSTLLGSSVACTAAGDREEYNDIGTAHIIARSGWDVDMGRYTPRRRDGEFITTLVYR